MCSSVPPCTYSASDCFVGSESIGPPLTRTKFSYACCMLEAVWYGVRGHSGRARKEKQGTVREEKERNGRNGQERKGTESKERTGQDREGEGREGRKGKEGSDRTGKERKGKARKERTGKELHDKSGKLRKGKERKVKGRRGREIEDGKKAGSLNCERLGCSVSRKECEREDRGTGGFLFVSLTEDETMDRRRGARER